MSITSPPRPPRPSDPVTHGEFDALVEALIEEARQRARRRRRRYGAAALIVAAVAIAGFIGFGGRGGGGAGAAPPARAPRAQGPTANAQSPPLGALPPDAGVPRAVAFDPRNPQIVYVLAAGWPRAHVFKTTDGGAHWRATATSGSGWVGSNMALTADPRHPGTLYAGTQLAVYKTVDGGRSWRPSSRGLFVPNIERLPGWVIALAVDPANSNILYAGSDRISKSSDGGRSWKTAFVPHTMQLPRTSVSALAIAPTHPQAIYAITRVPKGVTSIYKSTDAGATWSATTTVRGVSDEGFATALAVDPRHPTTVYAAVNADVLKTTNAGKTWQPIAAGLPIAGGLSRPGCHCHGGVTELAVDPRRAGTVYAALSQGGIYKTMNGGQSWIRAIDAPLLYMPTVAVDAARPATVYAAGDGGTNGEPQILRSTDSGRTWTSAG